MLEVLFVVERLLAVEKLRTEHFRIARRDNIMVLVSVVTTKQRLRFISEQKISCGKGCRLLCEGLLACATVLSHRFFTVDCIPSSRSNVVGRLESQSSKFLEGIEKEYKADG